MVVHRAGQERMKFSWTGGLGRILVSVVWGRSSLLQRQFLVKQLSLLEGTRPIQTLGECTPLAWAEALGMLHLDEEEFQVLAEHTLYRERGSLSCNTATRLHDHLKGSRGGGREASVAWDMQAPGREEAVLPLLVSG